MVVKPEGGPLSLRAPLRDEAPGSGVPVASRMSPLLCVSRNFSLFAVHEKENDDPYGEIGSAGEVPFLEVAK